ncbi:polysaccharide deacetylase family protein [Candidatus Woesearchaeota archaeon]|nr:polysaccharide deacetylase family protein [Candidatus Woesearchaeota archaeon]
MVDVCFYFQVHQPLRLRPYTVFDIGKGSSYFNEQKNREILDRVAKKCYLPANAIMLELLDKHPEFRASYSLSGVVLEQLMSHQPRAVDSFRELAKTGRVEFLDETYHHSLAFVYSKPEFIEQVKLHNRLIRNVFGKSPKVFRNTELIYRNEVAAIAEKMGYEGVLAEGADHVLGWRSPNFIYKPKGTKKISLLLKNYRLSDDIAFRFSERSWAEWPLTAEKFAKWVSNANGNGSVVNLFMDYETFGEHQWPETGIFNFMKKLPEEILKHPDNGFVTPSEAIRKHKQVAELDVPLLVSWADVERDLSAWTGNSMQQSALKQVYAMEQDIRNSGDAQLLEDWRRMQVSDHYYYMCTKWFADGDVHKYFNPYDSPYDGFIAFMNILSDIRERLKKSGEEKAMKAALNAAIGVDA